LERRKRMIFVDEEKCTLCGDCVEACPWQALSLADGKLAVDRDLCAECGACLRVCLLGAIYEVESPPIVTVIPSAAAVPKPETPAASRPVAPHRTPALTLPRVVPSALWVGALPLTARFVAGLADWWLDRRRLAASDRLARRFSRRGPRGETLPATPPPGSPGLRRRRRGGRGR